VRRVESRAAKLLYLIGERHVSEANLVRSLLAPGMNVVDVGANIGYFTLMFAQVVGPQGRIIAIISRESAGADVER
jgi:predicted methyltransferase